jgi:hypothetical protein
MYREEKKCYSRMEVSFAFRDTISPWVLIVHVFKKVFEKSVPLPWLEITSVNHVKERNHVKS